MNDLYVATSVNSLMIAEIEKSVAVGNGIVVVTTNYAAYNALSVLYETYIVSPMYEQDANENFANYFMPGLLGDELIPGTLLESWKVLSIDRLRFWYNGGYSDVVKFISALKWDRAFVSLDMGSPLPVSVMFLADELGREAIGIKTEPIATREFSDVGRMLSFSEYIVDTKEDEQFLIGVATSGKITVANPEKTGGPTGSPKKETLRKGLGLSGSSGALGILYDKRDEWQFRIFIQEEAVKSYTSLLIVPVDARSRELFKKIFPDLAMLLAEPPMLEVCDEIISFRYDENYCYNLPGTLKIVDYKRLNKAAIISPEFAKVIQT